MTFAHACSAVRCSGQPKQGHFATFDEIDFQVEVLPLLARDIVIPTIRLTNPSFDLERLADGRDNWTFHTSRMRRSGWRLRLRNVQLSKGAIALSDAQHDVELRGVVDTLGRPIPIGQVLQHQDESAANRTLELRRHQGQPQYGIAWNMSGTYKRSPVSGNGKLGGVLALNDTSRPLPLQAEVVAGDSHIEVAGTLTDLAHLAAVDLWLSLRRTSLDHLSQLTGVTLPATPPFATEGRLVGTLRKGQSVLRYEDFTARVGGSDLSGTLAYAQREPRPSLEGTLASNLIQLGELGPCFASDGKAKHGGISWPSSGKALLSKEFKSGKTNLKDQTMDLRARYSMGVSIFRLSSPLYVKGTFKNPQVAFDPTPLAVRGGAMVVLGIINPLMALIPLIEPDPEGPLPCHRLPAKQAAR